MDVRIAAILLGTALALAPPAGAEERSRAIDEAHPGYTFYRQYCASCHGLFADGLGPVVPALRSRPPDLTRLTEKYGAPLPEAALVRYIEGTDMVRAHGTHDMPVWGKRLSEDIPPSPAKQAAKRMTLHLVVDYLGAIQRAD
jgi:mono/diheme cytochrome c family protein